MKFVIEHRCFQHISGRGPVGILWAVDDSGLTLGVGGEEIIRKSVLLRQSRQPVARTWLASPPQSLFPLFLNCFSLHHINGEQTLIWRPFKNMILCHFFLLAACYSRNITWASTSLGHPKLLKHTATDVKKRKLCGIHFHRHKKNKAREKTFRTHGNWFWWYSKIRKVGVSSSSRNPSSKIKHKAKEVRCNHFAVVA